MAHNWGDYNSRMMHHLIKTATLQTTLEKKRRRGHRDDGKDEKVCQIVTDCFKSGVLQQQAFERMNRIGKWINLCDHLHPAGECLLRVDGSTRKVKHRV